MSNCVQCYERLGNSTKFEIRGLCSWCCWQIRKTAARRGNPIPDRPKDGESTERMVDGIRLWWWRDNWRAAKVRKNRG